jgi:hypothetical protein
MKPVLYVTSRGPPRITIPYAPTAAAAAAAVARSQAFIYRHGGVFQLRVYQVSAHFAL